MPNHGVQTGLAQRPERHLTFSVQHPVSTHRTAKNGPDRSADPTPYVRKAAGRLASGSNPGDPAQTLRNDRVEKTSDTVEPAVDPKYPIHPFGPGVFPDTGEQTQLEPGPGQSAETASSPATALLPEIADHGRSSSARVIEAVG